MNVLPQVAPSDKHTVVAGLWARLLFIHCDDLVFVLVDLKGLAGPAWVGMFDTFRDAFDYGVQRGFIPPQHLTLNRQEILGPDKPFLKSDWIPFKKELVVGLIGKYVDYEH